MNFSYSLKLVCLCLASFFSANMMLSVAVRLFSRRLVRVAERLGSSAAARLLFAVRMLPLALALLLVFVFCIPSYLRFEPDFPAERVSYACMALGLLGLVGWCASIGRAVHAIIVSLKYQRACELKGEEMRSLFGTSRVLIVNSRAPVVTLAGLVGSRIIISRGVLQALSAVQLQAALRHEDAHRTAYDNHKRLLLLLAPDAYPFLRIFSVLEKNWARFAEWAADDKAAAAEGSQCAVVLAESLVRVARLGSQRLLSLESPLLADDQDFSTRVERLLGLRPPLSTRINRTRPSAGWIVFLVAAFLGAADLWIATLPTVHRLFEHLIR
jgi:Zn-dependent protease with chaperone function